MGIWDLALKKLGKVSYNTLMRKAGQVAELDQIVHKLDLFFGVADLDRDPSFCGILPELYPGRALSDCFEQSYCNSFNGLAIRGSSAVRNIYCAAFPSNEVLTQFFDICSDGDLLFTHHPVDMRCGDPRGIWGEGFIAIDPTHIANFKKRSCSMYALHAPLDYNKQISTSLAIVSALNGRVTGEFAPFGGGNAGLFCQIAPCTTDDLISWALTTFNIPYTDFQGVRCSEISSIAVIAGCGDDVDLMKAAEQSGAQAYITGEVHCHIDTEYGRQRFAQMQEYLSTTTMSLIGVSHAASEQLVMDTMMVPWFEQYFGVVCISVREKYWWR